MFTLIVLSREGQKFLGAIQKITKQAICTLQARLEFLVSQSSYKTVKKLRRQLYKLLLAYSEQILKSTS